MAFGELGPAPLPMKIVEYKGTRNDPKLYIGGMVFGSISVMWPSEAVKPPAMGKPVILPLGAEWPVCPKDESGDLEASRATQEDLGAVFGDHESETSEGTAQKQAAKIKESVEHALGKKAAVSASDEAVDLQSKERDVSATAPAAPITPPATTSPKSASGKGPPARSWAELAKAPPSNGVKPSAIIVPNRRPSAPSVATMAVTYTGHLIHPRGLLNPGNLCYQNAVLQALLHCRPLYNLLRTVGLTSKHALGAKPTVLQAVLMFLAEFPEDAPGTELKQTGTDESAFAPEYIYTALQETGYFEKAAKGRQEDAQEYLGFLLDALHEELLAKEKAASPTPAAEQPQSWVEVGKKNKALETVETAIPTSPISNIFAGRLRSVVRCAGRKDSINVQPFEILPLDIAPDSVQTIESALKAITAPEVLEGFCTPSRANRTGSATKQLSIETLPPVIVLHVKRFRYDQARGAQKLMKYVTYGAELKIAPEILAPAHTTRPATTTTSPTTLHHAPQALYRLFAVVYHHGKHAAGGHYTADVQRSSGEWLRFDDTLIAKISETDVLGEKRDRQAYMLFYVRS
ncbi:hypothetical protein HDU86_001158 [Geranomyces michiganensis]|nr:hypothetical protein HDU86_001158 [Geranomyces michiganensis]